MSNSERYTTLFNPVKSTTTSFKCHDTMKCTRDSHLSVTQTHQNNQELILQPFCNECLKRYFMKMKEKKIMQHLFSEFYVIARIKSPQFNLMYIHLCIPHSLLMVFHTMVSTIHTNLWANFTDMYCMFVGWRQLSSLYMENDNAYFMQILCIICALLCILTFIIQPNV